MSRYVVKFEFLVNQYFIAPCLHPFAHYQCEFALVDFIGNECVRYWCICRKCHTKYPKLCTYVLVNDVTVTFISVVCFWTVSMSSLPFELWDHPVLQLAQGN